MILTSSFSFGCPSLRAWVLQGWVFLFHPKCTAGPRIVVRFRTIRCYPVRFCAVLNCAPQELCETIPACASCLPETSRRAPVANAREDSPVSDALRSIPEKRDAFLSPSRFSTYETHLYAPPGGDPVPPPNFELSIEDPDRVGIVSSHLRRSQINSPSTTHDSPVTNRAQETTSGPKPTTRLFPCGSEVRAAAWRCSFAIAGQVSFGRLRKARTTSGSNWLPEHFRIVSYPDSNEEARRYGLSDVMASRVSATANIRALSRISSPRSPRG